MQKITTSSKKTDFKTQNQPDANAMEPSASTLTTILNFAAVYRAQKVTKNQFIDMILN